MLDISSESSLAGDASSLTGPRKKSLRYRSLTPPDYGRKVNSPLSNALVWALPWSIHNYPGLRRGFSQMVGRMEHPKQAFDLYRSWHRPKGKIPLWAMERVRDYLTDRIESGLQVLAALNAEIASREGREVLDARRRVGFCEVRSDGRDRRGNWRK